MNPFPSTINTLKENNLGELEKIAGFGFSTSKTKGEISFQFPACALGAWFGIRAGGLKDLIAIIPYLEPGSFVCRN